MTKNIKIGIIISSFNPIIGGSEKQLELIGKKLSEKGYIVDIITRKYKGLNKKDSVDKINIKRIPVIYSNKLLEKVSFIFNSLVYLLTRKEKYDFVIASQLGSCSYIAKVYKKVKKIPYATRITGGEARILSGSDKGRNKFKKNCSNVDYFISINNDIYEALKELNVPEEKIKYITNGVELKERVNILENRDILYCGRIEKVKGVDILLEAWRYIENKIDDAKLIIVGDGSQKEILMKKYDYLKNVEWIGSVSDTSCYYKKARILVSPSRSEGISNTILEAMANGVTVIGTKVGGTPEIVKHNITGILIENEDINGISNAINRLLSDSEYLECLSKKSYDYINTERTLDVIVDKYVELINLKEDN